jgi:hypothetical protein
MIDIKNMFLKLTTKRYPHGKENEVIELLPEYKFEKDELGNYYIIIKKSDGSFSNSMFSSHLDTINRGSVYHSSYVTGSIWKNNAWYDPTTDLPIQPKLEDLSIKHVIEDDFIKTDGNSNLGADDKAGVVIMLNMISENIPGLYYFFVGEESGCIGSSSLSRIFQKKMDDGVYPTVNKVVAFDRRGYDSVITQQMGGVCCSNEFAEDLANKINEYGFWFKKDSTGIYTDSAEFTDIVPECTNLSVGYFNEHTTTEKQDIEFLELLAIVLTKIDWDNLVISRDITNAIYKGKKSTNNYNSYNYGNYYNWDEDGFSVSRNSNNSTTPKTYVADEDGTIVEENNTTTSEFDFDKWYDEQKQKAQLLDVN